MTNKAYKEWLVEIKNKVKQAQLKAVSNFNIALIELYWELGREIISKQTEYKWGENFLEHLSIDLKKSFPQINGFSRRNLYTIRQWYVFFSQQFEFVPQPVAQLPWSYQRLLISKIKDLETVVIYAKATHKNGWSRNQLEINIKRPARTLITLPFVGLTKVRVEISVINGEIIGEKGFQPLQIQTFQPLK